MGRIIAFGFLLNLSSAFGQTHFISLFNAPLRDSFGLSHGEIGALYSAATLCSAAVLPWAGRLIDSTDLRRYAAAVVCGLGAAAMFLSFTETAWHLAIAFFWLRLFGQGLSSHAGFTATARLAAKNRGKAVSVAGLGMSIGEAIAPPIVAAALLYLQWREVWQGAAIFQFVAVLLFSQMLLRGAPVAPPAGHVSRTDGDESWTRAQVLRDFRFWLAAPAIFAPPFAVTALFFHQAGLAEYKGVSFLIWTSGVAAYSAGSVLASLTAGVLTDKFGGARVAKWILAPLIMSVLLAAFADFPGLSFAYYALMGASAGMSVPCVNALWAELYGRAHLGSVRALAHSMVVLFSAAGPAAYGLLLDAGFSWAFVLLATAAWMFFAAVVLWFVPLQYRAAR